MLLNIHCPKNMTRDELLARLRDFEEQEVGLRGMLSSGNTFVGASRSDLRKMVIEVCEEIKRIHEALKQARIEP